MIEFSYPTGDRQRLEDLPVLRDHAPGLLPCKAKTTHAITQRVGPVSAR